MRPSERSALVALLLGALVFSYPLINVFNVPVLVLGIPLLYLYVFVAWLLFVGAAWLLSRPRD